MCCITFASLKTCGYIKNQLLEASTNIIIISNEFLYKKDIVKEIENNLSRGCKLIDIANLQTINVKQRMVYGLLENNTFSIKDADHVVFTVLSEHSRGSATIVHILTSLMKKGSNSRKSFELVKDILKFHIGHKRYLEALQNLNDADGSVRRPHHKLDNTIYLFINDMLKSDHFSLPAQHLLCCLTIVGSTPLPQFFVKELDNVVAAAETTEEDKRMKRLHEEQGVACRFPYPIAYHKDSDLKYVDPSCNSIFVPRLICCAIESEMDAADKAVSIMCVQNALEGLVQVFMVHIYLYYLLVLCVYGTVMKCDFCDRYTHERLIIVKENAKTCGQGICKDCLKVRIDPFISRICPLCQKKSRNLIHHVKNECPCRQVKCPCCFLVGNCQFIEGEHNKFCPKFLVFCPKKSSNSNTKVELELKTAKNRIAKLEANLLAKEAWNQFINSQAANSLDESVPVIVKCTNQSGGLNWYSDSFYTHEKGYKLCLCVHFKSGTHLSACLILMMGPYDSQLKWPLKGHCEVKLLNQVSNSEHFLGVGQYIDIDHDRITKQKGGEPMWYSTKFISKVKLCKATATCQYLKDDNIFFQINYRLT